MAFEGNPPFEVSESLLALGFDKNKAEVISDEMFDNSFLSCIDKTDEELKDNFKSFTSIPLQSGGIKFKPKQKAGIEAFTS